MRAKHQPPSAADPSTGRTRGGLTINEVVDRLPYGVSRSTVWRWIRRGVAGVKLPAMRQGGRWFISEADLRTFLEQCSPANEPARIRAALGFKSAAEELRNMGFYIPEPEGDHAMFVQQLGRLRS